jgi:hypothetical protein
VERKLGVSTVLRGAPSKDAEALGEMPAGDLFQMLDESLGWAWGYAGKERRVGYVPGSALAKH